MTASARRTPDKAGRHGRQRAGLNRGILAETRNSFANKPCYKVQERGARVVRVEPAYTSQTCTSCAVCDAGSRESQAIFCCIACGHRHHADINAAQSVLRRPNTAPLLVERSHRRLGEAGTTQATQTPLGIPRRSRREAVNSTHAGSMPCRRLRASESDEVKYPTRPRASRGFEDALHTPAENTVMA